MSTPKQPKRGRASQHGVTHITKSYENVFEALGFDRAEASDLRFRSDVMLALRDYFEEKGWNQEAIGDQLGIPQPRVSELVNGKINKVSSDKLIGYLGKLGFYLQPCYVSSTPKRPGKFICKVRLA